MSEHPLECVAVRRARLSDFTDLVAVERDVFGDLAWPADQMAEVLGRKRHSALVATTEGDGVVGFVIYRRDADGIQILDLAVDRGYRRRLIGSAILQDLAGRFPSLPVAVFTPRGLVDVNACLRRNGFRFAAVLRPEDHFLFVLDALPPDRGGRAKATPPAAPAAPTAAGVP